LSFRLIAGRNAFFSRWAISALSKQLYSTATRGNGNLEAGRYSFG